jgi:AraC-like DNA-binding protein
MMVKVAAGLGVSPEGGLSGTGLTVEKLADPTCTISLEQELAVGRNIDQGLGAVPGIGMLFAQNYRISMYGSMGLGMLSSPTGRSAFEFGLRYIDLSYACCLLDCYKEGGQYRIVVGGDGLPADVRDFFVDRTVMALIQLLHDLLPGDDWLRSVSLSRSEPETSHAERYRALARTDVLFGRERTEVAIDARLVDRPLPMSNEVTLRMAEAQCSATLADRRGQVSTVGSVREYLSRALPDLPGISEAARVMGLSERTLRRRLAEEGTSYKQAIDLSRRKLAEDLLRDGMLPSQVAHRAGYTELSSFSHAFKRWNGVSPRAYLCSEAR